MGLFGLVDFLALKAELTGHMAQHSFSIFKLYHITELMETCSEIVMIWMGCVATSVMGPCLVSLSNDSRAH
jgi:hypothetical protein